MISNFSLTTSDELREEKIVNKRVKKKTKQEINKEKQKAAKSKVEKSVKACFIGRFLN